MRFLETLNPYAPVPEVACTTYMILLQLKIIIVNGKCFLDALKYKICYFNNFLILK